MNARSADLEADPLADIVSRAVGEALDRRFWRMTGTSATVAALVSLVISLPITLVQNAATNRAATDRAKHNCLLLTTIADVMGAGNNSTLKRGGFLSTDAHLRRTELLNGKKLAALRPGPLKRLLTDPEAKRLERQSRRLDFSTTSYWRDVLVPSLLRVARVDCSVRG